MEGVTVLTLHYRNYFGQDRQFVCTYPLNFYDQGQSTDSEVKFHMENLGINQCRVQYDDFQTLSQDSFQRNGWRSPQFQRLSPKRKRRTISL